MPGQHIVIHVLPKIIDAANEFKLLPLSTRKCMLSQETQGFKFLIEYSRKGCELECAAQKAVSFCKCLPWYYPNNFTVLPMCDMFGSHCFDRIMSDQSFYKKCQQWCKEECQEISLTKWATIFPLGTYHNWQYFFLLAEGIPHSRHSLSDLVCSIILRETVRNSRNM